MITATKLGQVFKYIPRLRKPRAKARPKLYYLSLAELPLKNWLQIQKDNYTYTRKNKRGTEIEDEIAYQVLNDEYIDRYGLDKYYLKLLNILKQKAQLELDYILTGDRRKLTDIEIKEADVRQAIENKRTGITIEASLIHISKYLGVWININSVTTLEYYDLLTELEKHYKSTSETIKQSKKNGKNK